MQLLDPLRVVDVCLAARDVLRVTRIDEHDIEATSLENLEHWYPIDTGRLHRDGGDAQSYEPVGQPVQITREAPERPHGLRVKLRGHRDDMKRCPDVHAGSAPMHRSQRRRRARPHLLLAHHGYLQRGPEGGSARLNTFLNGIARGRHHYQVRNTPWTMFFYGFELTKKSPAAPSKPNAPRSHPELLFQQVGRRPRWFFCNTNNAAASASALSLRRSSFSSSWTRFCSERVERPVKPRAPRHACCRSVASCSPSRRKNAPSSSW